MVVVDPNWPITIAASADHEAGSVYFGCSKAIMEIATADSMAYFGKMYARELPTAFFELIAANLDGALAMEYRNYIRHQVKPCLDRITSILHANFAAIELPPLEWLVENFLGHGSVNNIVTDTIAYKIGWDSVLAQWDAQGKSDALFPVSAAPHDAILSHAQVAHVVEGAERVETRAAHWHVSEPQECVVSISRGHDEVDREVLASFSYIDEHHPLESGVAAGWSWRSTWETRTRAGSPILDTFMCVSQQYRWIEESYTLGAPMFFSLDFSYFG
eukprot:SAG31_NODE_1039_length_10212_cov_8.897063_6_plen_273_part_01